jgi:hypothetical protein
VQTKELRLAYHLLFPRAPRVPRGFLFLKSYSNAELLNLFDKNMLLIVHALQNGFVVELSRTTITTIF